MGSMPDHWGEPLPDSISAKSGLIRGRSSLDDDNDEDAAAGSVNWSSCHIVVVQQRI